MAKTQHPVGSADSDNIGYCLGCRSLVLAYPLAPDRPLRCSGKLRPNGRVRGKRHTIRDRNELDGTANCTVCGPVDMRGRKSQARCPNSYKTWKDAAVGNYGLTGAEEDEMRARPCAICGKTDKPRVIDHEHSTGKVRDALCNGCNMAFGLFRESPDVLRSAANYAERWS